MESKSFCYWLQGLFELSSPKVLNEKQVDLIKRHLAMVFKHEIDPSYGDKEHQEDLDKLHNPQSFMTVEEIKKEVDKFVKTPFPSINITQKDWDELTKKQKGFALQQSNHGVNCLANCACHTLIRC